MLMVYLLDENINTTKESTEVLSDAGKEVGLEVNVMGSNGGGWDGRSK
jgi:hypothetical protein